MRKTGFSNVDGFDNAVAIPEGQSVEIVRPMRSGFHRVDGFDNADALAQGGKYEIVISNADGEESNADGQDEFVFDENGNFVGDEGTYNANGEHYTDVSDETPFHFNADGEFDPDGEFDADGDHFENFLPGGFAFRRTGFFGVEGEEDDFMNAKGKRAAKQAAKQERKKEKQASKQGRKTQKVQAKVAKKAAKTEIKKAKAASKIDNKKAKQVRKTERMQLRNQPAPEIELPPIPGISYPEQEAAYQEEAVEITMDPNGTNVDMTNENGAPIDMQAIEELAAMPVEESREELYEDAPDDENDNFHSAAGKARRTARRAVKKAARTQKVVTKQQSKAGKAVAKTQKKSNQASAVNTRAEARGTKAAAKLELAKQGIAPGASIAQSIADTTKSVAQGISNIRSGRNPEIVDESSKETGEDNSVPKTKIKPGAHTGILFVVGGLTILGIAAAVMMKAKKAA